MPARRSYFIATPRRAEPWRPVRETDGVGLVSTAADVVAVAVVDDVVDGVGVGVTDAVIVIDADAEPVADMAALALALAGGDGAGAPVADAAELDDTVSALVPDAAVVADAAALLLTLSEAFALALTAALALAVALAVAEHDGCTARPVATHPAHEQGVGAPAPAGQKKPMGQMTAVAFGEPAGQKKPAVHAPSQVALVRTVVAAPKKPAAHGAAHAAAVIPAVPYVPAAQSAGALVLVGQKEPAGHTPHMSTRSFAL